jgi:hypothetical protein
LEGGSEAGGEHSFVFCGADGREDESTDLNPFVKIDGSKKWAMILNEWARGYLSVNHIKKQRYLSNISTFMPTNQHESEIKGTYKRMSPMDYLSV